MSNYLDISGDVFGRLTAIERVSHESGRTFWLCRCSCGVDIEAYLGHLRGGRTRSCGCLRKDLLHESVGHKNQNWKGGESVTEEGYISILIDGVRVMKHRHIMEIELGRRLLHNEIVHHVDEDKQNNNPDNLEIYTRSTHSTHHNNSNPVVRKLTKHIVNRIREFDSVGVCRAELSNMFSISRRHLSDVISGKYWRCV